MAWTEPYTWTAGETVTAAKMNTHVRDNFSHIGGTDGFTATPDTTQGIQPHSGHFAGASLRNYHIESGISTAVETGKQVTFANAFAVTPSVVLTVVSAGNLGRFAELTSTPNATDFTFKVHDHQGTTFGTDTVHWLAWGSDT